MPIALTMAVVRAPNNASSVWLQLRVAELRVWKRVGTRADSHSEKSKVFKREPLACLGSPRQSTLVGPGAPATSYLYEDSWAVQTLLS